MKDEWLKDKWDDKRVIETAEELESYLLHQYVAPEIAKNSTSSQVQTKTSEKKGGKSLA